MNMLSSPLKNDTMLVSHLFPKASTNAIAIKTKRGVVQNIKDLPYVKGIYESNVYKINKNESNNKTQLTTKIRNYDFTGKNIVIGNLDTGLDYNFKEFGRALVVINA